MSDDLDDFITIMDGRPQAVEEVSRSATDLRHYLSEEFRSLVVTPAFRDALPRPLAPGRRQSTANHYRLARIQQIIDLI